MENEIQLRHEPQLRYEIQLRHEPQLRHKYLLFLFVLAVIFLFPTCVKAATINISSGQNIQNILDSSTVKSGDTITVAAGTYVGNITIKKTGITLQASGKVLIKGAIYASADNVTVRGFEITSPTENAGIRTEANFILIEGNEIHNTMQDGIWFFGHDNTFKGNYIHDILDSSAAGTNNGDPHVDCFQTWDWNWDTYNVTFDSNICDHTRTSLSNQMVIVTGTKTHDLIFKNNRFIMHDGDGGYNPLALYGGTNFTIANNYFCNTTGVGSAAVYLEGGTNVILTGNTYAGYSAMVTGGGVTSQSANIKSTLPCIINPTLKQTPTTAPKIKIGDVNGDDKVDVVDIGILIDSYGKGVSLYPKSDVNGDGIININDIGVVIDNYGK